MDEYQVLIFFIGVAIAVCIYFLPAVITKKLILPNFNITPRVKLGTMLLLGLVTLIIAGFATYLVNGVLPSTSKWSFWMVIDYFYLFHFGKTKDVVQTTVPSLNPVQTNEQKPVEENIENVPGTDVNVKDISQHSDSKSSLLSQLANLSEDELKAVVKLASALSSAKEDKQKD
jgi:hypothetical protein